MAFRTRVTIGVIAAILVFILTVYFSNLHQNYNAVIVACAGVMVISALVAAPSR